MQIPITSAGHFGTSAEPQIVRTANAMVIPILKDTASAVFEASSCPVQQLSCRQIDDWLELEDRALEPNPFLSPLFVLPAVQYLTPNAEIHAILIHRRIGLKRRLAGVGIFEMRPATRVLPLPHLKAYQAPGNSFLTGLLVDRTCARDALAAFFQFLRRQPAHWQHLEFDLRTRGTAFGQLLENVAAEFGMSWIGQDQVRPVIYPEDAGRCDPNTYLSRNRRRKYRRSLKALGKLGEVDFEVIRHCSPQSESTENFLRLEHQGWKQSGGHSFRSASDTEQFFRAMSAGFGRYGRMFYTELRVGNRVVGSTSNLIAGSSAVAFKSGWDSEHAALGIGALQEIELVRHAPDELGDLELIDGGTGGASWLASLWPDERCVATGLFAGSGIAALTAQTMLKLRSLGTGSGGEPRSTSCSSD